jgi:putative tributyrin esterase
VSDAKEQGTEHESSELEESLVKHLRIRLPFAVLAIAFLASFDESQTRRLLPANSSPSPRVETVQFKSTMIGATLPYVVVLPGDYNQSTATRYPALYLLHGLMGHYSDWTTKTNVSDYATQYRMIIVMPEGNDGWYTDSATRPNDKYETYILRELIPDVDKRYRTIQARYGRAIAGLSMGGYGALKFGLKSPGTFVFAGSMSGAFAAPLWTESDLKEPGVIRDSVLGVFGPAGSDTRNKNDVFQLVRDVTSQRIAGLPYFYLDCGTEDGLISDNQKLAVLLGEKKIPHEFRELPGNHSWAYWDQQVQEVLKLASQEMRMPPMIQRGESKAKRAK